MEQSRRQAVLQDERWIMEQSHSHIALLIDADNISYTLVPWLLAQAAMFGEVSFRRAYGNWNRSSMHVWQEIASYHHIELRSHQQIAPGKNATDIALAIDAMDILYSGVIDYFCLVTSDSDYTPLVLRLQLSGAKVIGIGKSTTPLALKTACTLFVSTDQLLSQPAQLMSVPHSSVIPTSVSNGSVSTVSSTGLVKTEPLTLFMQAYEEVAQKEEREWVLLSSIGAILTLFHAPFSPAVYGHKNLLTFVKAHPDRFETRRQASKGKPVLVRRRRSPSPEYQVASGSLSKAWRKEDTLALRARCTDFCPTPRMLVSSLSAFSKGVKADG
jgi:uncharacterized protein (TIGR00288 family)